MNTTQRRLFFVLSIWGLAIALGLHLCGREQSIARSRLRASSWNYSGTQQKEMQAKAEVHQRKASLLNLVGLFFTFCGLSCLAVAAMRREQGWYLIPLVIFLSDVVVQMLL
jgi:hypothetical protein